MSVAYAATSLALAFKAGPVSGGPYSYVRPIMLSRPLAGELLRCMLHRLQERRVACYGNLGGAEQRSPTQEMRHIEA